MGPRFVPGFTIEQVSQSGRSYVIRREDPAPGQTTLFKVHHNQLRHYDTSRTGHPEECEVDKLSPAVKTLQRLGRLTIKPKFNKAADGSGQPATTPHGSPTSGSEADLLPEGGPHRTVTGLVPPSLPHWPHEEARSKSPDRDTNSSEPNLGSQTAGPDDGASSYSPQDRSVLDPNERVTPGQSPRSHTSLTRPSRRATQGQHNTPPIKSRDGTAVGPRYSEPPGSVREKATGTRPKRNRRPPSRLGDYDRS